MKKGIMKNGGFIFYPYFKRYTKNSFLRTLILSILHNYYLQHGRKCAYPLSKFAELTTGTEEGISVALNELTNAGLLIKEKRKGVYDSHGYTINYATVSIPDEMWGRRKEKAVKSVRHRRLGFLSRFLVRLGL